MALEKDPADIRAEGGVARMSDPKLIKEIKAAVTIPVMAKCRIGKFHKVCCRAYRRSDPVKKRSFNLHNYLGHFVEAQILEALEVDYIDESEVLTIADEENHINKNKSKVPYVCG